MARVVEEVRAAAPDETLVKSRRRQIFLAACRVLAQKSFHEASVKELALEAGLAAGSIYLYLQSKDEIIPLIAESMVAEFVEMLPAIRARTVGEPRRELIEVMRAILDVIDRYREAFNVLHHEARYLERRPQYRSAMKKIAADYLGAVAEIIERGKQMGEIRFEDSRSAVYAIHMLCGGWAMGTNYLKNTDKETYWREIAAIVEGRFFTPANGLNRGALKASASKQEA
jgi:AcrR family transcriptional regulator